MINRIAKRQLSPLTQLTHVAQLTLLRRRARRVRPAAQRIRRRVVAALPLLLVGCGGPADPITAARGQWLFINYWAEWCKPCIREVPELNALHEQQGYTVLGVNYDGATGEALQEQIDKLKIRFPTLAEDPASRFAVARPQVLPTTLVVRPDGSLQTVLIGPQDRDTLTDAAHTTRGSSGDQ